MHAPHSSPPISIPLPYPPNFVSLVFLKHSESKVYCPYILDYVAIHWRSVGDYTPKDRSYTLKKTDLLSQQLPPADSPSAGVGLGAHLPLHAGILVTLRFRSHELCHHHCELICATVLLCEKQFSL